VALGAGAIARGSNSYALGYHSLSNNAAAYAFGYESKAMGIGSVILGGHDSAMGYASNVVGSYNVVSGVNATAIGVNNVVKGDNSIAIGVGDSTINSGTIAMGANNKASGYLSTAIGTDNKATGDYSTAFGFATKTTGNYSTAAGNTTYAKAQNSTVLGAYNDSADTPIPDIEAPNDRLFQLGNGVTGALSNALTILRNANTGIGNIYNPTEKLEVEGAIKIADASSSTAANGTVRYTATGFEGRHGGTWVPFGGGGTSLWAASGDNIYNTNPARVGIGTNNPLARLHVADSSVVFSADAGLPLSPTPPPISGSGRRMMWYADKAAFRAGEAVLDGWAMDSIGNHSIALGLNPLASGEGSVALGGGSIARGLNSFALGNSSLSNGAVAYTLGYESKSFGIGSIILGSHDSAIGYSTSIVGAYNVASGRSATIVGLNNKAIGEGAFIAGRSSVANGDNSVAIGNSDTTNNFGAIAFGSDNNASGTLSTAIGVGNVAVGDYSTAMGFATKTLGDYSTTVGRGTYTKSENGTVLGMYNDSSDTPIPNAGMPNDRLLQLGNGDFGARSNALTILRNANTGIGNIYNPTEKLEVDGAIKIANAFNPSSAANGTVRYTAAGFEGRHGGAWVPLGGSGGGGGGTSFWAASGDNIYNTNTARVGVGTTTPLAKLHVADSNVLFSATGDISFTPDVAPTTGAGRRMMWYADKAAFRAGYVNGTQWNTANIGYYSTVFGANNTASGSMSFAIGINTIASGISAFVGGSGCTAGGDKSFAFGSTCTANGEGSLAMGLGSDASGTYSTAIGNTATASGNSSVALGSGTTAKAIGSIALGEFNNNADVPSTTLRDPSDRLFQIGNGTSASRKNVVTILRNGNFGIGVLAPTYKLEVNGAVAVTLPYVNLSDKRYKKDVINITNALDKVMQLRGVTFNWDKTKTDRELDNNNHIGFIAQEVEKVLPQVVVTGTEAMKTKSVA
jgi:hypothetical protein